MSHFVSLSSTNQTIDSLCQQLENTPSQNSELRLKLNSKKMKKLLGACITIRKNGQIVFGGQSFGELIVSVQEEIEKKEPESQEEGKTLFQEEKKKEQKKASLEELRRLNEKKKNQEKLRRFRKAELEPKPTKEQAKPQYRNNNQCKEITSLIQPIPGTSLLAKFNLDALVFATHSVQADIPKRSAICHVVDSVFVVGGVSSQSSSVEEDICFEFFLQGGKRRNLLKQRRADPSICPLGYSRIIASGGHSQQEGLSSVQNYLRDLDTWTSLPAMNQARCSHASCDFEGEAVYVFCGLGETGQSVSSIQRWFQGQSFWTFISLTGGTQSFKPTNCLRAIQIQKGVMILWGKHLDSKSVFSLAVDEQSSDKLYVTQFQQEKLVPNIDHSSAVRVRDGTVFAHDHYARETWIFNYPLWERADFNEIPWNDMGC